MAFALEDSDVYDAEQHAAALAAALTFVDQFSSSSTSFSPGPQLAVSPFPSDSELLGGLTPNLLLHDELQGFSTDDDELELLALNALSQGDDGGASNEAQVAVVEQIETVKPTSSRRKRQQTQKLQQQPKVPTTTELIKRANSTANVPKKPLKYNPNKARDERKEELIHLRKRVAELETQLHVLQEKRPRITACAVNSPSTMSGDNANQRPEQQLVIAGVWQDMANRQCEERIKSERENLRLKLVLENQIKIAKSLERLLKKKMSTKDVGHCPQCSELHLLYPPTKDRTDEEIYAHLAAGVEQSYLEVDSLFEANGLAHIETPYSDAQMRNDSCKGVYLEICANKVLPFELHSTGAAAWRHFSFAIQNTPYRYYSFDAPKSAETTDDTIVENFSLGLHANSTSAHFRVKQILRRYVEEDRIVIVWRSFVEPVEFSDEPLTGLRFREKGYIVIKRPKAIAGDYTLIQHCYIFTPNFNTGDVHGTSGSNGGTGGSEHPKVGAVTDFVLSATAANIAASHQMIENVLLAQTLKK
ncbi:hypothetical protein FI667_g11734, partial [Globisporangium splendens]